MDYEVYNRKNGQFVDVNVIGENKEQNTRVVEFDIVDVANLLNGKVKVDIDAMDYHHIFDVRIKFDSSSITLIKAEKPNEKEDPANKPDPNENRIQVRSPTKSLTQINNQILTQLQMGSTVFHLKC